MTFRFDPIFAEKMEEYKVKDVVILGHMNPDGDAAGSVVGLAHYIKECYPQYGVYPYLQTALDKGPKKLVMEDPMFDPFTEPSCAEYGVIVCDTATEARIIGKEFYDRAKFSIVLDHHAANVGYADVNHIVISESNCENVVAVLDAEKLEAMRSCPHPNAMDYFYMGILHDTTCFSRAKPSTLATASGLLALGVEHNYIMRTVHTLTLEDLRRQSKLLSMAQQAVGGKVAYLILTGEECEQNGFGYEDIHPISGILRDSEDIELAFTMFEQEPGVWRCSFRSDGTWIDVNELLGPFGGGGHKAAAGLKTKHDNVQQLASDIFAAIEKMIG